jgi:pimeloyl-ACP methyl ester carboxylesterase
MTRAVVWLPGTLCDARLFAPVLPLLGAGWMHHVPETAAHDSVSAVARAVLEAAPPRFALVGLSYGGILAFEIMRQQPARVERLALLHTTPLPPSDAMRERLTLYASMAAGGDFRAITTDHLKDTLLHPEHRHDPALRRIVLEMAMAIGAAGFLNQVRAQLSRPDSTPDLPGIGVPTLVMTGRQDTVCPSELHERMAASIPGAVLVIIEECGHLSPLEQPAAAADALRAWLHDGGDAT